MRKISGILVASALVASITLVAPAAYATETISGSGSSYMGSMQTTCIAGYSAVSTNKVTYSAGSSGAGRLAFAAGTTQFGGTDALYPADAPANFTYVPLIGGPVAIVFNVKGVKNINLTNSLLSDIFTAKITKWNDAKIKKVNAAVASKLPNATIQIVYRSGTSGTTNNFGNYMKQTVGGSWKAADAWADASGSTTGTTAGSSTLVSSTVKGLANSIGYVDLADSLTSGLSFAAIQNAAGQYIKPSVAASNRFISGQTVAANGEVVFDYKKKVTGGYNLSLIAYGLAPTKSSSSNAAKAAAVKDYFTYFINTCAPAQAAKVGYVAPSGKLKAKALELIATIK
jgi:phosphate transport system substrate-binding protein